MIDFPPLRPGAPESPYTAEQKALIAQALDALGNRLLILNSEGGIQIHREATPWPDLRYLAHTLYIDDVDAMSTTPVDLLDHAAILKDFAGDVLITGFGLGVSSLMAAANPNVTSVTVIEFDERVLQHVAGPLQLPNIQIIHADADLWEIDRPFDCAFLDHRVDGAVPAEVVDRYRGEIPVVLDWAEEREKLWQTVQ